jgi:hypothetical protein
MPEKETGSGEAIIRFGKAQKGACYPKDSFCESKSLKAPEAVTDPTYEQKWKIVGSLKTFDDSRGWHVHRDASDIEDKQWNIELTSTQFEIFGKSVDSGVSDVAFID